MRVPRPVITNNIRAASMLLTALAVAVVLGFGAFVTLRPIFHSSGVVPDERTFLPTSTPGEPDTAFASSEPATQSPAGPAEPSAPPLEPTATVDVPSTPTPEPAIEEKLKPTPTIPLPPTATPIATPSRVPPTLPPTGGLKAVVIVGPSGETEANLIRAEEFAKKAESYGMDVRRVYTPNATWAEVLANAQGANLVFYYGHGNGWPSIYGSFQERTKNGFGLDGYRGGGHESLTYYGADFIAKKIKLAPNAVVALSHLCYSAGNAEPGLPIPTWEVALERVDNYANGFLAAGAGVVFAYGTGSVTPIVDALFKTNKTMDEIFMTPGIRPRAYYGFTGWDDRYFTSTRTPGSVNHLDPGATEGFLRAISGNLSLTTAQWKAGR